MIQDAFINIIAGLVTTAVWAAIAWGWSTWRNWSVERTICKALKPEGISFDADGVGFSVKNPTMHTVVIRDVRILSGSNLQHQFHLGLSKASFHKGAKENERGWVELPPQTEAIWSMNSPARPMPALDSYLPLRKIDITLEYKTLFGATKIVTVSPEQMHMGYMLDMFTRLLRGELPDFFHRQPA